MVVFGVCVLHFDWILSFVPVYYCLVLMCKGLFCLRLLFLGLSLFSATAKGDFYLSYSLTQWTTTLLGMEEFVYFCNKV